MDYFSAEFMLDCFTRAQKFELSELNPIKSARDFLNVHPEKMFEMGPLTSFTYPLGILPFCFKNFI
jgi:hypothetical protein